MAIKHLLVSNHSQKETCQTNSCLAGLHHTFHSDTLNSLNSECHFHASLFASLKIPSSHFCHGLPQFSNKITSSAAEQLHIWLAQWCIPQSVRTSPPTIQSLADPFKSSLITSYSCMVKIATVIFTKMSGNLQSSVQPNPKATPNSLATMVETPSHEMTFTHLCQTTNCSQTK